MRRLAFLAAASLAFIAISEPISASRRNKDEGQFKNENVCLREGNCTRGCQQCRNRSWDCSDTDRFKGCGRGRPRGPV